MKIHVLSLGGSIVAPDQVDVAFLRLFKERIGGFLDRHPEDRLILVIGGGGPARHYQNALRALAGDAPPEQQDHVGIAATRLNAELIRGIFLAYGDNQLVTDPTAELSFEGRVLVGAGWKPGFSTDFDAVCLAERYGADTVVNLSNIKQVYTADPSKDASAKPLVHISWADFRKMVGDTWNPGANVPFDPIAARRAMELGFKVIVASGRNLDTVEAILEGKPDFLGTTIG